MLWKIRTYLIVFVRIIIRIFRPNWVDVVVIRTAEDTYVASAYDGTYGVYNNFGTTHEKAKEMALWNLKKCYEEEKAQLD
jgi:phage terminase large subunit